ncbi:hypothetical protein LTR85_000761 [Meristemomyces frigidus]|nr:hypothetical protein LTR85_000761 [Meristemomyces frigidus]
MQLRLLGLLLGLLAFVSALSAQGGQLLVVLEEQGERSKYSQFWSDLEARGFHLTFRAPKDTSLALFRHGVPAYSHLLLLPTQSKGLGPALAPNLIVDFINAGSNVLLALSAESSVPSAVSSLLLELDISLPPDRNSLVVDHFNYETKQAGDKHDVLLLPSPELAGRKGVKNFFSVDGLIAFPRAVGAVLGNASPLLSSILKAPSTAYTYNPKDEAEGVEDVFATGSQLSLVTAFQARNSARFTVLGSVEALQDTWFDASVQTPGASKATQTSNRAFAEKLTRWTFMESGVLRVGTVQHYLNEGIQKGVTNTTSLGAAVDVNPGIYRIKNDVHYSIELSEWVGDHWAPFTPPQSDAVQVEFSMLSPFQRLDMRPSATTPNSTIFTADFKVPDQHGIFNFFVEYRRPFYTNVEEKRTVTIRHFAHDEWPRSFVITGAYPWISGIWVTVAGWVGFVALWLYSKPAAAKVDLKVGGAAKR